jgi:ribA/ribD-fused uncharacterized protein
VIGPFRGKYRFLSNFYPSPIIYEGRYYATVEHAYQASKTDSGPDKAEIQDAPKPEIARRRGKALRVVSPGFKERRLDIMYVLVHKKFFGHTTELGDRLLETGEEELVEVNTWGDTFWGRCKGVGTNHLGQTLMRVRDELRQWRQELKEANRGWQRK